MNCWRRTNTYISAFQNCVKWNKLFEDISSNIATHLNIPFNTLYAAKMVINGNSLYLVFSFRVPYTYDNKTVCFRIQLWKNVAHIISRWRKNSCHDTQATGNTIYVNFAWQYSPIHSLFPRRMWQWWASMFICDPFSGWIWVLHRIFYTSTRLVTNWV